MGTINELNAGNAEMMADPTAKRWYDMMQVGGETGLKAKVEAVSAQANKALPAVMMAPAEVVIVSDSMKASFIPPVTSTLSISKTLPPWSFTATLPTACSSPVVWLYSSRSARMTNPEYDSRTSPSAEMMVVRPS